MEAAAGDAPSASTAAAASKRAPGLQPALAQPPSATSAADEPAASDQPGADDREAGTADPDEEVDDVDVFNGRPDLAQNTIEELRSRHRELKQQQKKGEIAAAQPKAQTRPGIETHEEPGHRISPPGAYGQRHRFQRGRLWRSKRSVSLEMQANASRLSTERGALQPQLQKAAPPGERMSRIAQIERSAICGVHRAHILTHTNPLRRSVCNSMYIEQET